MYPAGSKQTFTITPDAGYEIESVQVDGKSVGITEGKLTLYVNEPYRIKVTFRKAENVPGIEVGEPGNQGSPATPNPQTGDSNRLLGLLAAAGGALAVVWKKRKR